MLEIQSSAGICRHAVFGLEVCLNYGVMGPGYTHAVMPTPGTPCETGSHCRIALVYDVAALRYLCYRVVLCGHLMTRLALPTQDCSVRVWDRRQAQGCCGCQWLRAPALSLSLDPCSKVLLAVGRYARTGCAF